MNNAKNDEVSQNLGTHDTRKKIKLSESTLNKLKALKIQKESYDNLINRLIDAPNSGVNDPNSGVNIGVSTPKNDPKNFLYEFLTQYGVNPKEIGPFIQKEIVPIIRQYAKGQTVLAKRDLARIRGDKPFDSTKVAIALICALSFLISFIFVLPHILEVLT